VLRAPADPPSDATNYLGALAEVALFANDRQIQEAHFRREQASEPTYTIRLWTLD
jgi:hypothetical protein